MMAGFVFSLTKNSHDRSHCKLSFVSFRLTIRIKDTNSTKAMTAATANNNTNIMQCYSTPVSSLRKGSSRTIVTPPTTPRRPRRTIGSLVNRRLPSKLQMPNLEDDKTPTILHLKPRNLASNYFWMYASTTPKKDTAKPSSIVAKRSHHRPPRSSLAKREFLHQATKRMPRRCDSCDF